MSKTKKVILTIIAICLLVLCGFLAFQFIRANVGEVKNPVVTLELENYGEIKIELYPEYAPNTVKNIIKLVESGYYDSKVFYGADEVSVYIGKNSEGKVDYPKLSTIMGETEEDYEYEINGEFVANNFEQNTLRHEKGTVSLVRADYGTMIPDLLDEGYNSGASQFTILTKDARSLNGMYAGFGKVIEGMEIVEEIYNLDKKVSEETSSSSIEEFEKMPVITKATVETYGIDYGMPEVHEAFDYEGYMNKLLTQYYTNN